MFVLLCDQINDYGELDYTSAIAVYPTEKAAENDKVKYENEHHWGETYRIEEVPFKE